MIADGQYIDNSWELVVNIDDFSVQAKKITVRVSGHFHIGLLIRHIISQLPDSSDWADYAIWLPHHNCWLLNLSRTLDQNNIQADKMLGFFRRHNDVKIILPSLESVVVQVDFASKVFSVVVDLCQQLAIRHPEELSLMLPIKPDGLKHIPNNPATHSTTSSTTLKRNIRRQKSADNCLSTNSSLETSGINLTRSLSREAYSTLSLSSAPSSPSIFMPGSLPRPNRSISRTSNHSLCSFNSDLLNSQDTSDFKSLPTKEILKKHIVPRPRDLLQKARLNSTWLESHRSLMEQTIRPQNFSIFETNSSIPILWLRFKYFLYFDLVPKLDSNRIHQLFEQARWTMLSNQIECTQDEINTLAAIQLQIVLCSNWETQKFIDNTDADEELAPVDEIDVLLDEIEAACEGRAADDETKMPSGGKQSQLTGFLKLYKKEHNSLKKFKKYWCVIIDKYLSVYKKKHHVDSNKISLQFSLRGCEMCPDINLKSQKFINKLLFLIDENKETIVLDLESPEKYAQWTAAIKVTSNGKTIDNLELYGNEVNHILTTLKEQDPKKTDNQIVPKLNPIEIERCLKELSDFLPENITRSISKQHLRKKITKLHLQFSRMDSNEAKLRYIEIWQRLVGFGVIYFLVRFENKKRDDLIGIVHNRLLLLNMGTGHIEKYWHFNMMKSWQANWDSNQIDLLFKGEKISFTPLTASCKIVLEFIGGYVFLVQRTLKKNQELNEDLFHQLTGVAIDDY